MTDDFVVGEFDPAVIESVVNGSGENNGVVENDGKRRGDSRVSIGKFRVCDEGLRDYVPCLDNVEAIKRLNSTERGESFERHCPERGLDCLVPRPKGYKLRIPWPKSRDEVYFLVTFLCFNVSCVL